MKTWFRHHVFSLRSSFVRLVATPVGTALNIVVIGVALSLPLGAYVLLLNLQALGGGLNTQSQISLFLDRNATREDNLALEDKLRRLQGVKLVQFVSRAAALEGLGRSANLADVIGALRENPLPDAFILTLEGHDAALTEGILKFSRALPKVTHVQTDSDWALRLDALIRLGRTGLVLLAGLLAVALVAISFNTIRLQVATQRDEIDIARLVGGTHAYIRRPFLYFGGFLGLLGGLLALGVAFGVLGIIGGDVRFLAGLYSNHFQIESLGLLDCFCFLGLSALLGWLGSYLSVSAHLFIES